MQNKRIYAKTSRLILEFVCGKCEKTIIQETNLSDIASIDYGYYEGDPSSITQGIEKLKCTHCTVENYISY